MTALLQAEGAEVLPVEPFQANANYAKQVLEFATVYDLSFSRFHQFPLPQNGQVDVVNVLNCHALAHVLSPWILLEQIFTVLTPEGYLFPDEKDVLHPVRRKIRSPLNSGAAHQLQQTMHTTARYVRSTGFKRLECEIDKHRNRVFPHIKIVARKPQAGGETTEPLTRQIDVKDGPSLQAIHHRLWWLECIGRISLSRERVKKKTQQLLRRPGF